MDRVVLEELSGLVHGDHFATGSKTRIDAQGRLHSTLAGQEEVSQIRLERSDRFAVGGGFLFCPHLADQGCLHQPFKGVGEHRTKEAADVSRPGVDFLSFEICGDHRFVEFDCEGQYSLGLATAQGQHVMGCDIDHSRPVVAIHFELCRAFRKFIFDAGGEDPFGEKVFADVAPQLGFFRDLFGQNIRCALERFCRGFDAESFGNVRGCFGLQVDCGRFRNIDGFQKESQGLQSLLASDGGARPLLRFEGQVEVLELRLQKARFDFRFQFAGQFALLGDRLQDGGLALLQLGKISEAFGQRPELDLVHLTGPFLAVAGDERHSGPTGQKLERVMNVSRRQRQFPRDQLRDIDHRLNFLRL